jgi:hypothetical protein
MKENKEMEKLRYKNESYLIQRCIFEVYSDQRSAKIRRRFSGSGISGSLVLKDLGNWAEKGGNSL